MSDFCYSRPMLKRVLKQAELMDRMRERLGVGAATAARLDKGTAWYEARTRCIACHSGNVRIGSGVPQWSLPWSRPSSVTTRRSSADAE